MGLSYTVQRTIAASPTTVWQVLTDKQALLAGDFGITQLEGELAAGGKLLLRAAIAPKQVFKRCRLRARAAHGLARRHATWPVYRHAHLFS